MMSKSKIKIHGISIRHRKTKEIVKFIKTDYGTPALKVLSGVRINMSPDYVASEEIITEEEYNNIK